MKVFILALLLSAACTRYSELSRDSVSTSIQSVQMGISDLKVNDWKVGQHRMTKVSDSFSFLVEMPRLREEDMDYLTQQMGINAWITRLIFKKGSFEQDLGSTFTLFRSPQMGRLTHGGGPAGMVNIKVFYAAKFASERFRSFKCPAFNHNKKISRIEIRGEKTPFDLSLSQVTPYEEKSQLIGLTPSSFNAGHTLVGEYFLEIAPYDSIKKTIHASFQRIPQHVAVGSEDSIQVSGCEGIHPEKDQ